MKLFAPLLALVALVVAFVRRLMPRKRVERVETAQAITASVERAEEAKAEVTADTAAAVAPYVAQAQAVVAEVAAAKTPDRQARRAVLRKLAKRVDQ
jgi:L-lactate permease